MHIASIFRGIAGIVLSLVILSTVTAQYSGGSNMLEDSYEVATAANHTEWSVTRLHIHRLWAERTV